MGPSLACNIPGPVQDFRTFLPASNPHSMFLTPVTESEISTTVKTFKNGSPGWDNIKDQSEQLIVEQLSEALCYVCNLSFKEVVFPKELKITKVVPIYKSNDPMEFTNYRPISLLSFFQKFLNVKYFYHVQEKKICLKMYFSFPRAAILDFSILRPC